MSKLEAIADMTYIPLRKYRIIKDQRTARGALLGNDGFMYGFSHAQHTAHPFDYEVDPTRRLPYTEEEVLEMIGNCINIDYK